MGKKILVIGSLNMDMVIPIEQMPLKGETILGGNITHIPGGKGANQACAVGKLGGDVVMLGCVGDDQFGKDLCENLMRAGVDVSHVGKVEQVPTGIAVILVDAEGSNSIVVAPGTNSKCDVQYLKDYDEILKDCDFVIFQMEIPKDAIWYGIFRAKELGKTVILNPAPVPEFIPEEILQKIDYITPNEVEAVKLAGLEGDSLEVIEEAAGRLLQKGIANVLVTLGSRGVMLMKEGYCEVFPARKVDAVDTTAAGDCFNGAFAVGLAEGMAVEEAIAFGNLASSIAVTRKGAQSSIPARSEVDALQ